MHAFGGPGTFVLGPLLNLLVVAVTVTLNQHKPPVSEMPVCYFTCDGCMVVGLWGALASFSAARFIADSTMSAMSCLSSAWCSPTRGMEEPTTCATWRMVIIAAHMSHSFWLMYWNTWPEGTSFRTVSFSNRIIPDSYLCDEISAIFPMDSFDCADIQTPENLWAGIHPQLVPKKSTWFKTISCITRHWLSRQAG